MRNSQRTRNQEAASRVTTLSNETATNGTFPNWLDGTDLNRPAFLTFLNNIRDRFAYGAADSVICIGTWADGEWSTSYHLEKGTKARAMTMLQKVAHLHLSGQRIDANVTPTGLETVLSNRDKRVTFANDHLYNRIYGGFDLGELRSLVVLYAWEHKDDGEGYSYHVEPDTAAASMANLRRMVAHLGG